MSLQCSARQHVPLPEFKQNLEAMVRHLHTRHIHGIVLMTAPPVHEEGRIKHNAQVRP